MNNGTETAFRADRKSEYSNTDRKEENSNTDRKDEYSNTDRSQKDCNIGNPQWDRYADMLDLPHHVSSVHKPMSKMMRAAQFSPFAALSGFEDAVDETARLTENEMILTEDEWEKMDHILFDLQRKEGTPYIRVTYFVRDARKEGGSYCTAEGCMKRLDPIARCLQLSTGQKIYFHDIVELVPLK